MHVVSMTRTIVAPSDQAVHSKGDAALPTSDPHHHPPGTVLDMPDDEALGLVARGIVEPYDRKVHGNDPKRTAAALMRPSVTVAAPLETKRTLHRLQSVPRSK